MNELPPITRKSASSFDHLLKRDSKVLNFVFLIIMLLSIPFMIFLLANGNTNFFESHASSQTSLATYILPSSSDIANEVGKKLLTNGTNWLGTGTDATSSYLGLHFLGGNIPVGSAISNAQINFPSSKSQNMQVQFSYGILNSLVSNPFSLTSLPSTQYGAAMQIGGYTGSPAHSIHGMFSLDVTKQVQSLLSVQNRSANLPITFLFKGMGPAGQAWYFENNKTYAPQLLVTYSTADSGMVTTVTSMPTITQTPSPTIISTSTPLPTLTTVPSTIWGDNLTMNPNAAADYVVTNSSVQSALKSAHVGLMRMPYRDSFASGDLQKGFQAIKNIGAVPNLILNGETYKGDTLATDTTLMNAAINFFGNTRIYFDFGNEENVTSQTYTQDTLKGWNVIIPKMKAIMAQHGITEYRFGGPIAPQATVSNDNAETGFFLLANPKPDYIAWHEYACASTDTTQTCLDHTDTLSGHNYAAHIDAIRSDFTTKFGQAGATIPFILNEWDYAPQHNVANSANTAFMTDYTTRALNVWAGDTSKDTILGTAHYPVDGVDTLVTTTGQLTAQGLAFKASFEKWNTITPSLSVTPTPVAIASKITTNSSTPGASSGKLMGMNFAGPDFGENGYNGWSGASPLWVDPSYKGYSYMQSKKLTLIRMPIAWETLEPVMGGALSQNAITHYASQISAAQSHGEKVLIDIHNYGMFNRVKLTLADDALFQASWKMIATEFSNKTKYPAVWGYELMNEPHDLVGGCQTWESLSQAGLNGVRAIDNADYVLIPGYGWQSAVSWQSDSDCLKNVTDAAHKMYFSAHQYFDKDYSGQYSQHANDCLSPTIGVERVTPFLQWLQKNDMLGFMSEFGVPADACFQPELNNFLQSIYASPSIVGATYWASFPTPYALDPIPTTGADTPQGTVLGKYPSI